MSKYGWICPKCDAVNSPSKMTCDCTKSETGKKDPLAPFKTRDSSGKEDDFKRWDEIFRRPNHNQPIWLVNPDWLPTYVGYGSRYVVSS